MEPSETIELTNQSHAARHGGKSGSAKNGGLGEDKNEANHAKGHGRDKSRSQGDLDGKLSSFKWLEVVQMAAGNAAESGSKGVV